MRKIPGDIRWIFAVLFIFLVTMTIFRFIFYLGYNPVGKAFSGSAFIMGFRFDLKFSSIIAFIVFVFTRFKWLNPFRGYAKKFWNIFIPILFIVMLFVYAADYYHYDYLKQRLNATVLNYLQDAAISFNMMWQTYPVIKGLLLLVVLSVAAYFIFSRLLNYLLGKPIEKKRYSFLYGIATFLILGGFIFGKFSQFNLRWSDAFTLSDDYKAQLALNPMQSFFSSLKFRNSSFDREAVKSVYPLVSGYLGARPTASEPLNFERRSLVTDTFTQKPNVVLVICESFSMYKSSMVGNPLNTTPFFNKLCKAGVFFDRCFTPAYGTARGVWATITGIPDVEMPRTASRNPAAVNQHTIISDFKGYTPFYFLGGNPTWANIQGLLSNNIPGLKLYQQDDFKAKKIDVWGISDKNLLLEANDILGKETTPFFAIIQTADNHRPYTIPEEDKKAFNLVSYSSDSLRRYGFENNAELNAFRYTDFSFKLFMEAARKKPYFNNTIFVFVGDHGIRGNAGDMLPKSYTEQGLVCEHVPLLFYAPSLLAPRKDSVIASQLDILPSIASIAKVPYRNTTFGKDLFDSTRRDRLAFIIDHDVRSIGMLNDEYYFLRNLKSGKEVFVTIKDNVPLHGSHSDSNRIYLSRMATAWYETARYMLLNNPKKN